MRYKNSRLFELLKNFAFFVVLLWLSSPGFAQPESNQKVLHSGYFLWDPYAYQKVPGDPSSLTGLDVELTKLILKRIGYEVEIPLVDWRQHQEEIRDGKRDIGMGAFYSDERDKYAYFSVPYRYEEDSLFVPRDKVSSHKYHDVDGFLKHVREAHLKIGVIDGYRYADNKINDFIADPKNKEFIEGSKNDNDNLNLLIAKKIDGFLADRIVGATILWRQKMGKQVSEKRLNVKAPVYMLMSKKTISKELRDEINESIKELKGSPEYTRTISWYLYPVLLLETTDSQWFMFMEMLGIIAFAISGVVVAYRTNATLFGCFILSLVPSFGGGVLRDVIFGRYPVWFVQAKFYLILVIMIVIAGFILIRLNQFITLRSQNYSHKKNLIRDRSKLFDVVLMVTDAIGLAAFTVAGVIVSLIVKSDPLILWGPFFAFVTGAGGGILRDVIIQRNGVQAVVGELYAEIAVIWGFILSLYLTFSASDVNPENVKLAVIGTIISIFLTRVLVYTFKVPNIYLNSRAHILSRLGLMGAKEK